jgi:hypothetical protein
MLGNLYETTEATLVAAHKAGCAYWRRNRTMATDDMRKLESLARTLGYHGEEQLCFMSGLLGTKRREGN